MLLIDRTAVFTARFQEFMRKIIGWLTVLLAESISWSTICGLTL